MTLAELLRKVVWGTILISVVIVPICWLWMKMVEIVNKTPIG